ncbi:hypothetical protein WJX77_006593 [Trebouxia sp. C0004]
MIGLMLLLPQVCRASAYRDSTGATCPRLQLPKHLNRCSRQICIPWLCADGRLWLIISQDFNSSHSLNVSTIHSHSGSNSHSHSVKSSLRLTLDWPQSSAC